MVMSETKDHFIAVRIEPDLRKKIRSRLLAEGSNLQELLTGLLDQWLAGKRPPANVFDNATEEELRYAQITIAVLHSGSNSSAAMLRAILDACDSMRKHGAG